MEVKSIKHLSEIPKQDGDLFVHFNSAFGDLDYCIEIFKKKLFRGPIDIYEFIQPPHTKSGRTIKLWFMR